MRLQVSKCRPRSRACLEMQTGKHFYYLKFAESLADSANMDSVKAKQISGSRFTNINLALWLSTIILVLTGCLEGEVKNSSSEPSTVVAPSPATQKPKLSLVAVSEVNRNSCSSVILMAAAIPTTDQTASQQSSVSVVVSVSGAGALYADSSCSSEISALTLAANESAKVLYFKSSQAGSAVLQAVSSTHDPAAIPMQVKNEVVQETQPSKIQVAGANTMFATSCSSYLVSVLDSKGLTTAVTSALTVGLTSTGSGQFYSDSSCSSSISSLTIPVNQAFSIVYYRTATAESASFLLQANGYQSAQMTVTSSTPPVSTAQRFSVSGPSVMTAGACVGPYSLKLLDQNSLQINATSAQTAVMTSDTGGISYFSDSGCSTALPSSHLVINSGQNQKSFYARTTVVSANRIVADDQGSALASSELITNIKPAAAASVQIQSSGTTLVDSCSLVNVTLKDAFGNTAINSSSQTVSLSDSGSGGFFSDSSCTNPVTTVTLPSGSADSNVYFRSAVAGASTLTAAKSGLTSGTSNLTVSMATAQMPAKILITGPVQSQAASCSTPVLVTIKDSLDRNRGVAASTTVNLSSGLNLYSDATCTTSVSTLSYAVGEYVKTIFYRQNTSGSYVINASSSGLTDGNHTTQLSGGSATKVNLSGVTNPAVDQCSAYTVAVQDASNNLTSLTSGLAVSLTTSGSGSFYSDSSCTSTITSLVIAAGSSASNLYFKTTSSNTQTLTATPSLGLTAGTLAVTATANPVTQLALTAVSSFQVGQCVSVQVQSKDAGSVVTNVGSAVTVNLSTSGSGLFYSDSGCTSAVTSVNIASGSSSQTLYFKSTAAENQNLTAAAAGLTSAVRSIGSTALPPSQIVVSGTTPLSAGSCSAVVVSLRDSFNNLSGQSAAAVINVTGLSGTSKLYSDASCSQLISAVTVNSGENSKTIYYKNDVAEAVNAVFDDVGSLTAANRSWTTQPQAVSQLQIAGSSTTGVASCLMLTVSTKDNLGNLSYLGSSQSASLGGAGTGGFYSDSSCTTPVTTAAFSNVINQVTVYFKPVDLGSYTLIAQMGGVTDGAKLVSVNAGSVTQLALIGGASINASTCSLYTVQTRDANGYISPVTANTSIVLSGAGSGIFYSDSSCSSATSTLVIPNGSNESRFYYRNTTAGSVTLNVDDTGSLTAATLPVTVTSTGGGPAVFLKITGASSLGTNNCTPFAISSVDSIGGSVSQAGNLSVSMAGEGDGDFYSDASCATTSSSVTISAGQSLSYIYFKNPTAQNLIFAASASGVSTATFPVSVLSGSALGGASKLVLSGLASIQTNACVPYVVSVADNNNNSVNSSTNLTVNLSGDGGGDFFTNSTCTTSASGSITISSGSSYQTVYYKNTSAENLIFVAQTASLANGLLPIAITSGGAGGGGAAAGPAIKLSFISQPSSLATVDVDFVNQPIVIIQDSNNNVVSSSSLPVTLSAFSDSSCTVSAGGTLSAATNPMAASGGVVNFSAVKINTPQTIYLKATATGLAAACSSAVQVYPSVPARLEFSTQPSASATAGVVLASQPVVSVLNHSGQVVTTATNSVTLSAFTDSSCSVPLAGGFFTVTQSSLVPTSGVVNYAGVKSTKSGTVYLQASASGLTSVCSTGIVVAPAAAASLAFSSAPPTTVTAASAFAMQIRVLDAFGNISPVSDSISLSAFASGTCTGGPRSGFSNDTASAVLGTANFNNVTESVAGVFSILATNTTNGSVTTLCSGPITVTGGAPSQLAFTTQPSTTGIAFARLVQPPVVAIRDAGGNLVTSAGSPVTLAAFTDNTCTTAATGAFSADTNPLSPNAGYASFTGVYYGGTGTIYLKATSSGLTSACSNAVTVGSAGKNIAVGEYHACAIQNGNVFCWGRNDYGQLGLGNSATDSASVIGGGINLPTQVPGLSNVVKIAAAANSTCAINSSAQLYCWGYNNLGQLGTSDYATKYAPVYVAGSVSDVAMSLYHTCYVQSTNVYCSGYNSYGELGNNSTSTSNSFVTVLGVSATGNLGSIVSVSVAMYRSCALSSGGSVFCWGMNNSSNRTLGTGDTGSSRNYPGQVLGVGGSGFLSGIDRIAVAYDSTCAANTSGALYCWGSGTYTGNGGSNNMYPGLVTGGSSGWTGLLAAGDNGGTSVICAGKNDNKLYCWGQGGQGQIGDGATSVRYNPTVVIGINNSGSLNNIWAAASGGRNTCAVDTSANVYCWGDNDYGQLGVANIGYGGDRTYPAQVWNPGAVSFSQMSVGWYQTCGVSKGLVYCWGRNSYGLLGDGTTTGRSTPVPVLGVGGSGVLSGIISVSSGGEHTCALSGGGLVYCWGYNGNGNLGDNTTINRSTPVQVKGVGGTGWLTNIVAIATGDNHSCAVNSAGSLYCWGYNGYGNLGDSSTTQRNAPVQVVGVSGVGFLSSITRVAAGAQHTCASSASTVYCWGRGDYYQLGNNSTSTYQSPIQVFSPGTVTDLHAAFHSTCVAGGGTGYCWGYRIDSGGSGSSIGTTPSTLWSNGVTSITASAGSPCAVVNGLATCQWSSYYYSSTNNYGRNIAAVRSYGSGSSSHLCALSTAGTISCVGYNGNGQLGDSTTNNNMNIRSILSPVPSGISINSASTGSQQTCSVVNGGVNCWGDGQSGALGNNSTAGSATTSSVRTSGGTELLAISNVSSGQSHSCALSFSGAVYCWGDGQYGVLGNNTTSQSLFAVQVSGQGGIGTLSDIVSIGSGHKHNCAVSSTGSVYCWGWDAFGQLGNNSTISAASPNQVVGVGGSGYLSGATQVVNGHSHSCALTSSGSVYCWGNNSDGQLGANVSVPNSTTPLQVVSVSGSGILTGVTALAAGAYHTCAISGGQSFCWGRNNDGQLGDSSYSGSSYPVGTLNGGFVGLTGLTSIAAGKNHSCAVNVSGNVLCWGSGASGQLGLGTTVNQTVAATVVGTSGSGTLSSQLRVYSGPTSDHTCSVATSTGAMYCWGSGAGGQMGTGATPATQLFPVQSIVTQSGVTYMKSR